MMWLKIMVCYAEQEVVNHGVLHWANGCKSWVPMLSQWLWIIIYYAVPRIVNYGVPCRHHDLQSRIGSALYIMINNQWLSITHHDSQPLTGSTLQTMIQSHCLSIAKHNSQPLAQHPTPWFRATHWLSITRCESWFIMFSQWLVVNHVVLWRVIGCES
jgi:hypothetical protein